MKKNTAGQKWVVFAFDETDNTAKTGDAANITAKVSIDGAAGGATTDVNPTEIEDGYYAFDIDADETNGDYLVILPDSATANIQVVGVPGGTWTTFPQSVDNETRLATIETDTTEIGTAGAGLSNINLPNQTMDIVGNITGNLSGSVGSVTGAVGSVAGNVNGLVTGTVAGKTPAEAGDAMDLIANAVDANALASDAVDEIWAKAMSDLAGMPAANASVLAAINIIFMALRNEQTSDASSATISNDAGTPIATAALSDVAGTFTKGEYA